MSVYNFNNIKRDYSMLSFKIDNVNEKFSFSNIVDDIKNFFKKYSDSNQILD